MTSSLLAAVAFLGASGAVVVVAVPLPSRARRRARSLDRARERRPRRSGWGVVDSVGRRLRRHCRRPPDAAADRRAGLAVVLGVPAAVVHPALGLLVAGLPFGVHVWRRRRGRSAVETALIAEFPDVVDLFRVAAGAGLTVHQAIEAVRGISVGPVAHALGVVHQRVSHGERLTDALPELAGALGEPTRPLVAALMSAERDGAPLREPLERVATIARDVRRRRAEETARRVPVQLLFPLVACVLPAFALLTVVPLLAGTLRTLSL